MKIVVVGKTDATISLNKIGVPVKGKETAVLNIDSEEKNGELRGLISAGLLEIVNDNNVVVVPVNDLTSPDTEKKGTEKTDTEEKPKAKGRPKGSKNKSKKTEQQKVNEAEAETQKMGSRVVVGTGEGAKEGRMRHSFVGEIEDSEKTKESIEAMEKLEKEEEEEIILPDRVIDESKLDPSEQMGRKAVISTQSGNESVGMVNSILPEAKEAKNRDPFIDRESKDVKKAEEAKKDEETKGDDFSDAFINI